MEMTFKQFQATGHDVADLSQVIGNGQEELEGKPGRVYLDGLYIEREPDGRWYLLIENEDWLGEPLVTLEQHLFRYASDSGLVDEVAS
jgi:hypothetical protein